VCLGKVDDRLKETIDPYINHPSFAANNDLLIILFDEAQLDDDTCSGPTTIAMTEAARIRGAWKCGGRTVALFLGPSVKRGYQSTKLYHLEAFLRISLEGLGVTDSLPGASAFAPDMNELFTTATPPPPTAHREIVLYTQSATKSVGQFHVTADASAAGGSAEHQPDLGAAKLTAPLAAPANYFDITFNADAGTAYRIWLRAKADRNAFTNDSVYLQFSQSVTSTGAQVYRLGTTSATTFVLEDCSGCAISGWGWNDNGYGVLGPLIYFATSGTQTLRVQAREDGISIDQIVLSADKYLTKAPGALRADATILPKTP